MLTCEACGTDYALTTDAPYRCDCGHALEYADSLVPAADAPPDTLDRDRGLWAVPDCLPVSASATERALDRLHAAGFYTEPTCATAPAALEICRDRGILDADADVVIPLTGSGLKI